MIAELSRLATNLNLKKPIGAAATGKFLLLRACYDSMHAVFLLRKHAYANNSVEHRTNKLSCHAKSKTQDLCCTARARRPGLVPHASLAIIAVMTIATCG
jgi:hypothetical protein